MAEIIPVCKVQFVLFGFRAHLALQIERSALIQHIVTFSRRSTETRMNSLCFCLAMATAQILADDLPGLEVETNRILRECTPPTRRTDIMEEETADDLKACVEQLEASWKEFFQPSPGSRKT